MSGAMENDGEPVQKRPRTAAGGTEAMDVDDEKRNVADEINRVQQDIRDSQVRINAVQEAIEQLQSKIDEAEKKIISEARPGVQYWVNKEKALRDEKKALMDEKKALMEKEAKLMDEQKALMEKEAKLMDKDDEVMPEERVAGIDFLVESQLLKHNFDVNRFMSRVTELFEWYHDTQVQKSYVAPYFPLVQSSGSGKTKLLFAAHKFFQLKPSRCDSYLLLCTTVTLPTKPTIYSSILQVSGDSLQEKRVNLCKSLDGIINKSDDDDIVLFFDEAQCLLVNDDAFLFRCVQWWLRIKRTKRVVAVFSGTTSGLADYYIEHPMQSGTSRDPKAPFIDSGPNLFDPFFDLCTTGIFAPREPLKASHSNGSDFERAVSYGRPLFALLHKEGALKKSVELAILKRMFLSTTSWFEDDLACLSILSTRVQMGQTSLSVASNLVKKGYANLTYFSGKTGTAQIAYFPDPVCARLAMCVMDPSWSLEVDIYKVEGHEKKEWSKKIIQIMSSGLCRPHKGDLGEVAAALFMLFCGDELRAEDSVSTSTTNTAAERDYRHFSISLTRFVSRAILRSHPDNPSGPLSCLEDCGLEGNLSFIQVCRDHFRPSSFSEHFDPNYLAWLYAAGCACYVYSGCPAIDLVAPIRRSNGTYIPMVVSVKARRSFCRAEKDSSFDAMKKTLKYNSSAGGVCVLFLIGLDNPWNSEVVQKADSSSPNPIMCVLICLKEDDAFGLSNVVTQTTIDGDAISEVFASHPLLHPRVKATTGTLLRRKANEDVSDYFTPLCQAFKNIPDEEM